MQRCIKTAMAMAFIFMISAQAHGDSAKARGIANQVCAACHGFDGNSPLPSNPSIAGQHADYLLKQLSEFKSGVRNNPIMTPIAATLSADDMRDLASYYSSLPPKQMAAKDAALVEQGRKFTVAATRPMDLPHAPAVTRLMEPEFRLSFRVLPASMPITLQRN